MALLESLRPRNVQPSRLSSKARLRHLIAFARARTSAAPGRFCGIFSSIRATKRSTPLPPRSGGEGRQASAAMAQKARRSSRASKALQPREKTSLLGPYLKSAKERGLRYRL